MLGAVVISAAGQHKRIAVSNLADVKPAMSLSHILRDMRDTLSNRAFLWLVFAALFGFVNQGITFSMNNYLLSFFWQFTRRSEEHTSELQYLMRIYYPVLCLKKKNTIT